MTDLFDQIVRDRGGLHVEPLLADLQQLMDFRHSFSPLLPLFQFALEGFNQAPDILHRQVGGPMPLQHLGRQRQFGGGSGQVVSHLLLQCGYVQWLQGSGFGGRQNSPFSYCCPNLVCRSTAGDPVSYI